MKRRDARSLDHQTLEEMRRMGVRRVVGGETQVSVAKSLEVNLHTVSKWMRRYRNGGEESLAGRKATGRPSTLTEKQMRRLQRVIVGKNPRQLNFGPALWTLPLVGQLIERLCGVALHKTTISRMLHRLGVTPQKPIRRAFQRDEIEIKRWMQEEFPRIVRASRRWQSTFLFADETGIHEDHAVGRTWGERGNPPVVRVTGTRRRINVISAISPRGRLWFRCYPGNLSAPGFVEYLKALRGDISTRIDLIIDKHPAHVAALTRKYLLLHKNRIRVHYLPGYAPEINPDEHVWSYVKGAFRRDPLEQNEDLSSAVTASMDAVKNDRPLVRSFFDHPEVKYIKDTLGW